MRIRQAQWLVYFAYFVALILPLAFNPFAHQPFSGSKVALFWVVVVGMLVITIHSQLSSNVYSGPITWTKLRNRLFELPSNNPLYQPILIYAAVYVLATIQSIDPALSLFGTSTRLGTITIISLVLFCLMVSSALGSRVYVERLITALLVGSVPVALYGWLQYFGLDPLEWSSGSISPVQSTAGYSLFLGAYLVIVIPFTLSRIIGGEADGRKRPIPYLVVLILQVICLIFTLSRGAWLGLLVSCLLFLWLLAYRWQKKRIIVLSFILLIAGSYLYISMNKGWVLPPPSKYSGLSDIQVVRTRTASNIGRTLLWRYTIPMISGRYLLGYGPETYTQSFLQYYPPESFPELSGLRAWDPHNIFLYHLTSTGVLGLLAFLYLLFKFYKITFEAFMRETDHHSLITIAAIISSATAFLIQSQFNPYAILPLTIFWLVLALGVGMYRKELA